MMHILIAEDEPSLRLPLTDLLSEQGYIVTAVENGEQARDRLGQEHFDLVLSDIRMPRLSGMELFKYVRDSHPECSVILMTAYGEVKDAVEALKQGAWDYLLKPFDDEEILTRIARLAEFKETHTALQKAKALLQQQPHGLIGQSNAIKNMMAMLPTIATSDAPVLIQGETGTGKELVAKALHTLSERQGHPFVSVNCAALPDTMIESELFGHEKGAFTDASQTRVGRFRRAHQGTLFLDEVAELSAPAQAKLLRVLQEGVVEPLGSDRPEHVETRILAATHRNLEEQVQKHHFRQDLMYRLKVVELQVPPLRDRLEDIPVLVEHFIQKHKRLGMEFYELTPNTWERLQNHTYPGNVRELEQTIRHAMVFAIDGIIDVQHLPAAFHEQDNPLQTESKTIAEPAMTQSLAATIKAAEREAILNALQAASNKKHKAAEILGISRKSLWEKMKSHQLSGQE